MQNLHNDHNIIHKYLIKWNVKKYTFFLKKIFIIILLVHEI